MTSTKIVLADLGSSCREFFNGCLGIAVALLVSRGMIFRVFLLGVQSSCNLITFVHVLE